ncbi:hypothetical protein Prudu_009048, partial [Prunus dulcis]
MRLRKALYGLKQSPRAWFGRFTMAMKNNGFKQCNSDHTLILETSERELQDYLATEFEMKDLGGLKYFLGIEEICLGLLTDTGMLDCKPADTSIVQNHHLGEYPDQVPTNKERYQRLVGRLIYLSHTRPDIAYAVSVVSQFMHSPSEDHINAVLRILRYLKSAPRKGLMFSKHGYLNIDGYLDADWAGNVTDRKSTSGYFTLWEETSMLGYDSIGTSIEQNYGLEEYPDEVPTDKGRYQRFMHNPSIQHMDAVVRILRSKKKKVVSLSSVEAEYRALVK